MTKKDPLEKRLVNARIGITGANGSLGKALTKKLKQKGAYVIGLTHQDPKDLANSQDLPNEWMQWECGKETELESTFANIDILIINHGINPQGRQSTRDLNQSLEINALSSWRLIQCFEKSALNCQKDFTPKELWVNTSEAEIQPAFSPAYELSKRLIGQLVSLKGVNLSNKEKEAFSLRKLILGPFKSKLNPIGLMSSDWVASQIIFQANIGLKLIIVTPNPITYILVPINEVLRAIYYSLVKSINQYN